MFGKCGFKENFFRVIQVLCDKINGDLSDLFVLERVMRQGLPIPPLLFALFSSSLGQLIKRTDVVKGVEVLQKVTLFTDDVFAYLEDPEVSSI